MADQLTQLPLVTIITVTYNSAAYVREAIESVLSQSYDRIEYIIGDDCSTDSTWDIISQYNDPRIIAYRNETNLREYPNRNKAVSLAKGKYLLFIDGDDLIYPHALEFIIRMSEAFPTAAMTIMRSHHNKLFYPVEVSSHDLFVAEYFDKSLLDIAFTNTLFKTDALREVGGLSGKYISGDTYVRLLIAKRYPAILINDNLTWWRQTPGQATLRANSVEGLIQRYQYKSQMLQNDSPLNDDERMVAIRNMQIKICKTAIRMFLKGKVNAAFKYLNGTGLIWKCFFLMLKSEVKRDPFAQYSSVSPYKLPLSKNPFARPVNTNRGSL